MSSYDWAVVLLGIVLQSMVLSVMLRGSLRIYPFVFTYVAFSLLSTVVQYSFQYHYGWSSREFIRAYWIGDFLGTFLVLMIIIHLIRAAMEGHKHRNPVYFGLLLGMLATGLASTMLMSSAGRGFSWGKWMTEAGRDYYFSAVLLNAILWCTLVRSHHENKQLYLLTSGLGLKLTGAAIAHALRLTGASLVLAGYILVVTYFLGLYVWYIALKKLPFAAPAAREIPEASAI